MDAGIFTAAELIAVRLKAEQAWANSQYASSLKPKAAAAQAVIANQTATFEVLNNRDKDLSVDILFIDACGDEAVDCEATCSIDAPELAANKITVAPNICKEAKFKIDVTKLRKSEYTESELILNGYAKLTKSLDEFWAQQILAKLKLFAGVNVAPAPFTYDAVGKTTEVPAADYNLKILGNWLQQAELNSIENPYFIDNGHLFLDLMNARFDAGNLDGKGLAARMQELESMLTIDQYNFAKAGLTEDTFLIGAGAVAFKTVNKHPDIPMNVGGKVGRVLSTINSNLLTGVKYDLTYETTCEVVGGEEHYFHTWRARTHGLVELNPKGCPVTIGGTTVEPTGVLSYSEDTTP